MTEGKDKKAPRSWKRKALSWGLQILLLLVIVLVVSEWQARHLISRSSPAPELSLRSLDGEAHSLAEARGKTVVLYFFAPWCSVCRYSSHNIVALRRARSEQDVAIYAVGLSWDRADDVARFAQEHGLNVPVLLGNDDVQRRFNIQSFPTIYIVDEEGQVQDRVIGYTTELGLRLRSL